MVLVHCHTRPHALVTGRDMGLSSTANATTVRVRVTEFIFFFYHFNQFAQMQKTKTIFIHIQEHRCLSRRERRKIWTSIWCVHVCVHEGGGVTW